MCDPPPGKKRKEKVAPNSFLTWQDIRKKKHQENTNSNDLSS